MAKKKGAAAAVEEPAAPTQYNVRLNDDELARRVARAARGLGLDGANFLRLMIRECLPVYERRSERIGRGELPEGM